LDASSTSLHRFSLPSIRSHAGQLEAAHGSDLLERASHLLLITALTGMIALMEALLREIATELGESTRHRRAA
jgi:hypothetical protein